MSLENADLAAEIERLKKELAVLRAAYDALVKATLDNLGGNHGSTNPAGS